MQCNEIKDTMTGTTVENSPPLKVLVVDDTATNRQILQVFLKKLGFVVIAAEDGAQAVKKFESESPDLILMDVMMPVMDGYEATREIKRLSKRWVPVVFLSALDKEENLVAGLDAGGDDYLAKPVNFVILDAKLRSLRRSLDLQRQLDEQSQRLQEYHDFQESENQLAQDIVKRQMLRSELSDPSVHHWVAPAANFSGDIVAATRGPAGELYILLADATGHGLGAAICTLPVLSVFYSLAESGAAMSWIITEINRQLKATMPIGRFVAATVLCINQAKGEAEVWVGGTPDLLLIDESGALKQGIVAEHLPLGIDDLSAEEAKPLLLSVLPTDQFVVFSDGVLEAGNSEDEQFGFGQMRAALASAPRQRRLEAVQDALIRHVGSGTPHDDISLMVVDCG
jgi:CheY-like chemotaxis protein